MNNYVRAFYGLIALLGIFVLFGCGVMGWMFAMNATSDLQMNFKAPKVRMGYIEETVSTQNVPTTIPTATPIKVGDGHTGPFPVLFKNGFQTTMSENGDGQYNLYVPSGQKAAFVANGEGMLLITGDVGNGSCITMPINGLPPGANGVRAYSEAEFTQAITNAEPWATQLEADAAGGDYVDPSFTVTSGGC